MLLYDPIFHREMCSMICQTGRPLPDHWPRDVTSHHPCNRREEEEMGRSHNVNKHDSQQSSGVENNQNAFQ